MIFEQYLLFIFNSLCFCKFIYWLIYITLFYMAVYRGSCIKSVFLIKLFIIWNIKMLIILIFHSALFLNLVILYTIAWWKILDWGAFLLRLYILKLLVFYTFWLLHTIFWCIHYLLMTFLTFKFPNRQFIFLS